MANIFISIRNCYEQLPPFYEGFINGLKEAGNNVLVYIFKQVGRDFSQPVPPKVEEKMKTFSPDLCIFFNNHFWDITKIVDCDIVIYDVDSPMFYSNKDAIKINRDRYKIVTIQKIGEKTIPELFGLKSTSVRYLPPYTCIKSDSTTVPTVNIGFVGTNWCWGGEKFINRFISQNPSCEDLQAAKQYFSSFTKNVLQPVHEEYKNELSPMFDDNMACAFALSGIRRLRYLSAISDFGLELHGVGFDNESMAFFPEVALCYNRTSVATLIENQNFYNRCKIGFNTNHLQATSGFSWRVCDVMASNACLLTEFKPDLKELFPKVPLLTFTSEFEARDYGRKLLENESLRNDIVAASHEAIEAAHRIEHVVDGLNSFVKPSLINASYKGTLAFVFDKDFGIDESGVAEGQKIEKKFSIQVEYAPRHEVKDINFFKKHGDNAEVLLSVIMPVYNVEKTINEAIDSVLMQHVNFQYEILIVDDASTDNTYKMIKEYEEKYSFIKVIKNEVNSGNAISFYNGLSASRGKYFCVLDGDDFYTVNYKLQKQVDFFESDIDEEYFAVTHKYICMDLSGNMTDSLVDDFSCSVDRTFMDVIDQRFYSHTSTYMYRNVYCGNVPEVFKEELMRGDNPRTFFHVVATMGKVKTLDFVGSVYRFDSNGIWTSLSPEKRVARNHDMFVALANNVPMPLASSKKLHHYADTVYGNKNKPSNIGRVFPHTIDDVLSYASELYRIFSEENKEFISGRAFSADYVDSLCESMGRIVLNGIGLSPLCETPVNNVYLLVCSSFGHNDPVFSALCSFIEKNSDKKVYLLITDIDKKNELSSLVLHRLNRFENLSIGCGQKSPSGKIQKIFRDVLRVAPEKVFFFSHSLDAFGAALVQSGLSHNTFFLSSRQGIFAGVKLGTFDDYIVHNPADQHLLAKSLGCSVTFIRRLDSDVRDKYVPYKNHTELRTASGCRSDEIFYNVGSDSYVKIVIELLRSGKGKHFHYGPVPVEIHNHIVEELILADVDVQNFVNVPFTEDAEQSFLDYEIDAFYEFWPVNSEGLSLAALRAGVPMIHKKRINRSEIGHCYPESFILSKVEEVASILDKLGKESLLIHSSYANKFKNSLEIKSVVPFFVDTKIINIKNCYSLFEGRIKSLQQKILHESKKKVACLEVAPNAAPAKSANPSAPAKPAAIADPAVPSTPTNSICLPSLQGYHSPLEHMEKLSEFEHKLYQGKVKFGHLNKRYIIKLELLRLYIKSLFGSKEDLRPKREALKALLKNRSSLLFVEKIFE